MSGLRYMLDTNIVSSMIRDPRGLVQQHIEMVGDSAVCTSSIVVCELRYGAARKRSERLRGQLERVLGSLEIEPLNPEASQDYARIRHALDSIGRPIGPNDLFIAAHALSLGVTLVTHNTREFLRVPGLKVEDWLTTVR